ncbi:hypothetical protein LshimejAT787_0605120 [Lyophyllum shimeji]|uniref:Uncharacterized protein n=1 Tax=Lyophyllum shimeji TaxID=47721 RepID=A0A9P3PNX2_LYOSH|nr:hypothetical protein LshimejAT787_0605120 [Lyophyllum shimeji]
MLRALLVPGIGITGGCNRDSKYESITPSHDHRTIPQSSLGTRPTTMHSSKGPHVSMSYPASVQIKRIWAVLIASNRRLQLGLLCYRSPHISYPTLRHGHRHDPGHASPGNRGTTPAGRQIFPNLGFRCPPLRPHVDLLRGGRTDMERKDVRRSDIVLDKSLCYATTIHHYRGRLQRSRLDSFCVSLISGTPTPGYSLRGQHCRCRRFVAFEGASTVALIAVCELIMILRVYALYGRSIPILASLLFLWVCQIVISSVGLSSGFALDLPPGFIGCIFSSTSPTFPSLWVAPLVTDTLIFALTLLRTRRYVAWSGTNLTLEVFMRDGAMYFLVIFIANLANTLLYFLAPADLKAIGASFSQLITSTMVSRLVLNLRSAATYTSFESAHRPLSLMEKTIGHLGEGIEYSREDDQVYGGTDDHDIPLTPLRKA